MYAFEGPIYGNAVRSHRLSASQADRIHKVKVIKEVDAVILVEVRKWLIAGKCIDEVEVVKEVNISIAVHIGSADIQVGYLRYRRVAGMGNHAPERLVRCHRTDRRGRKCERRGQRSGDRARQPGHATDVEPVIQVDPLLQRSVVKLPLVRKRQL